MSAYELLWAQLTSRDFSDTFYNEIKTILPNQFRGGIILEKKPPRFERIARYERRGFVDSLLKKMITFFRRSTRLKKGLISFSKEHGNSGNGRIYAGEL
jgi:hypothetical protein